MIYDPDKPVLDLFIVFVPDMSQYFTIRPLLHIITMGNSLDAVFIIMVNHSS